MEPCLYCPPRLRVLQDTTFCLVTWCWNVTVWIRSRNRCIGGAPLHAVMFQHKTPQLYCRCSSVGIATGYGLDGSGIESRWGARYSAPVQTNPGAHPASCTMGTGSFPGVNFGGGVTLTPHNLLVSWSRKSRAISLFPLWAVRSVQSLSACTRVHFTFNFTSVVFNCI
jgi:hypothetical protein